MRAEDEVAGVLSEGTRAVLDRLAAPVEIRFYSMLDSESASPALFAFARRVDSLLAEFEHEAIGRIKVVRHQEFSVPTANAAIADGIRPFNMVKGNGSFLGLAIACNERRETIPALSPQWESALESDISRAIERATTSAAAMPPTVVPSPERAETLERVRRRIPDIASVSMEEGARILQESALKDFQEAARERQAKVEAAEARVAQAQSSQFEAERQSALKELQEAQAEQKKILQQIAARFQAELEALKQLKE